MKQYVCIDIGGTEIKYGVLDENERFLTKDKMPTEAFKGGPSLLEKAVGIVREYLKLWRVDGICVSTAGMVDVEKGEIFYSAPLIPDYAGTKIKARMESEFGLPCEVENDVNCAGLSEAVSGAAAGSRSALCLTVGTGIGGCIIIDGNVYHGFSNSACEVGYMHMEGSDFQTLGAASILASKVALAKGEPVHMWNGLRIFELAKAGALGSSNSSGTGPSSTGNAGNGTVGNSSTGTNNTATNNTGTNSTGNSGPGTAAGQGWVQDATGWYYVKDNGSKAVNETGRGFLLD